MASPPQALPRANTVPFVAALAAFGERAAIRTDDVQLSYRDLAARIADVARRLGEERRLVLIAGSNQVETLVSYLAAMSGGHPVLLVSGAQAPLESLVATYDPDVVMSTVSGQWRFSERRAGSAHELHPDLALLLSTSGSTGSPKLVRLSHKNLQANAESIAQYLDIRSTDRAATTLPMHYCYGLSVINSHLLRGAGLILTDLSVVDACFWDLFKDHGGTTFAGVPYTFDLLDRVGFKEMRLPHLRYVTQAGGRLAPDKVARYSELGQRSGWDLFVMYGQTEATARMAYLPPDLATAHPNTIGVPIPGGSFTLEPVPDHDDPAVGELVYSGPNVMLGYAEQPADLSLGRSLDVLHTGDLARRTAEGLFEVVGRRSGFAKLFGLRIDQQRVDTSLAGHGITACCAGSDDELIVAVEGHHDAEHVQGLVAQATGLPAHAVRIHPVMELPRLVTGKPDRPTVRELARHRGALEPAPAAVPQSIPDPAGLRDLYAELLGRSDVTEDSTFVSLGGDSLSYVEMSVRLEEALDHLPANWHVTPIRELAPVRRRRRPGSARAVETSVVLRAVAILLIVGTHVGLFKVLGSAHVLLAVAGFNFARFQLTSASRADRVRHQVRSIVRVAVPSMIWIATMFALTDAYGLVNVFLLNGFLGPESWTSQWHFWFIEVLVYILVALAAVSTIPWVDRMERRFPFGFAVALLTLGLLTRFGLLDFGVPHPKPAFWLFALGWATAKVGAVWQRVSVTLVIVATVPGFFGDPRRDAVIAGGLVLLAWVSNIRVPAGVSRAAGVVASSSLYIYLTHWQVYPRFADHAALAVVASTGVGVAYWMASSRVTAWLPAAWTVRHRRVKYGGAAPVDGLQTHLLRQRHHR